MLTQIKIKIKSTVTDLVLAEKYTLSAVNGFFRADDGKIYGVDKISELASDVIEVSAWGTLDSDGDVFTVRYRENENIGFENCITSLLFSSDCRDTLIMTREGDVSTAFKFDLKEKRQICRYETPILPMEFVINTRSLHNTVDVDGGSVLVDYNIELHGVNTERNRLFIEIIKA